MTEHGEGSFDNYDWTCRCGNQPPTDGFYPCLKSGRYVPPTEAEWADGDLYRCARCDAVIEMDPDGGGRIVGVTAAAFLDQPQVGQ
ncbi:MAG: hypothetical protein C0501_26465 [Isosphaera sp.]|nr:hypothetical protein [Isosphaera sp.]